MQAPSRIKIKNQEAVSKCSGLKGLRGSTSKSSNADIHVNINRHKYQINLNQHDAVEVDDDQGDLTAEITDIGNTYSLGGVLTKRIQELLTTMNDITTKLKTNEINNHCEDDDIDRAIKRSIEFDSMFSRNHLYELQRLLKDSKLLLAVKSPKVELESKILAGLKSVTQALQVYAKHVGNGNRVKYQLVVPIFQSINTINSLLEKLTGQHLFPLRPDLEMSCNKMKQILLEMSVTETPRLPISNSLKHVKSVAKSLSKGQKVSSDLSMYNLKNRKPDWKSKAKDLLSRRKYGLLGSNMIKSTNISENQINTNTISKVNTKDTYKKTNYPHNREAVNQKPVTKCDETKSSQGNKLNSSENKEDTPRGFNPLTAKKNTKALKFRNATRAVPEDSVKTMMETIGPIDCEESFNIKTSVELFQPASPVCSADDPLTVIKTSPANEASDNDNTELNLSLPASLLSYRNPSTPTSSITSASFTKADGNDVMDFRPNLSQSLPLYKNYSTPTFLNTASDGADIKNFNLDLNSVPPSMSSLLIYPFTSSVTSVLHTKTGGNNNMEINVNVTDTQSVPSSYSESQSVSSNINSLNEHINVALELAKHLSETSLSPSSVKDAFFTSDMKKASPRQMYEPSKLRFTVNDSGLPTGPSALEKPNNIVISVEKTDNNVQLVCLKEGEASTSCSSSIRNGPITKLIIEETAKNELYSYQQDGESSRLDSHPTKVKALEKLESVATDILGEIILDFQQEQVDGVIEKLVELELQTFQSCLQK